MVWKSGEDKLPHICHEDVPDGYGYVFRLDGDEGRMDKLRVSWHIRFRGLRGSVLISGERRRSDIQGVGIRIVFGGHLHLSHIVSERHSSSFLPLRPRSIRKDTGGG